MSQFALTHWQRGKMERVYINGDFVDGLGIYFMKPYDDEEMPRVFSNGDSRGYPEPFASSKTPDQDVARQALEDHGLDMDDFYWEDLLEVAL